MPAIDRAFQLKSASGPSPGDCVAAERPLSRPQHGRSRRWLESPAAVHVAAATAASTFSDRYRSSAASCGRCRRRGCGDVAAPPLRGDHTFVCYKKQ